MQRNTVLFVIIAALGGFIAGFMLANSINRSQVQPVAALKPEQTQSSTANTSDQDLSPEEIKAKIAQADKDPSNFAYQRDLGIALYRYAAMKQDTSLLDDSVRILERAYALQPSNYDVLVALGNAKFDIGYANKDNKGLLAARDLYTKALEIKPSDADVATDRSLTYFFQEPPDYAQAAAQLQKVGDANPKHERSLQFLVQALVKQGRTADAEKALAKLKSINPGNRQISDLESQIASANVGK